MTFKLPKARPTSKAVTDTHTRSKIAAECLAVLNAPTITPQVLEQMARNEEAHKQKLDAQNMREHAARVRRQAEAAKQVQDDQRVIADAMRSGVFAVPLKPKTKTKTKTKPEPTLPGKERKPTREDTLTPCIEWAIEACMSQNFNGLSDFSRLVLGELQANCDQPDYPITDTKPDAILVRGEGGKERWVTFDNILSRLKRKFKNNGGLIDVKRKIGRSVSGQVVGIT